MAAADEAEVLLEGLLGEGYSAFHGVTSCCSVPAHIVDYVEGSVGLHEARQQWQPNRKRLCRMMSARERAAAAGGATPQVPGELATEVLLQFTVEIKGMRLVAAP